MTKFRVIAIDRQNDQTCIHDVNIPWIKKIYSYSIHILTIQQVYQDFCRLPRYVYDILLFISKTKHFDAGKAKKNQKELWYQCVEGHRSMHGDNTTKHNQ